jgi:dihydroorotase
MDADLTIFSVENRTKTLIDSNQNELTVAEILNPTSCVVAGNVYQVGGTHGSL